MLVAKHRLISLCQSVITFTSRSLLVLPAAVNHHTRGDDQSQAQHTNVDGMACNVARTVGRISLLT